MSRCSTGHSTHTQHYTLLAMGLVGLQAVTSNTSLSDCTPRGLTMSARQSCFAFNQGLPIWGTRQGFEGGVARKPRFFSYSNSISCWWYITCRVSGASGAAQGINASCFTDPLDAMTLATQCARSQLHQGDTTLLRTNFYNKEKPQRK